eukprot:TRINITY_DN2136_c0_g1_i1.p1 TRINITY_DN2136_c0_g1~~TRINITY_DN2136_c0_g1_i1.p1  ORF type:complete len:768 (-),score=159.32 TRINITY_DN2136_c0_g1_i1:116-2419(-)
MSSSYAVAETMGDTFLSGVFIGWDGVVSVMTFAYALAEFMCGFFGIVLIVFLWGTTENWKWHSHKSYENAFWGFVSFWASIAFVSKVRLCWWFPDYLLFQIPFVFTTPVVAMIWHRHRQTLAMSPLGGKARAEMQRAFAEKKTKLRRSLSFAQLDSQEAKNELSHELNGLIHDLNYGHMTMRAARYKTVKDKQNRIYTILYAASHHELNFLLTCSDVNLAMLFLNVKDYEVFEFTMKRSKSGYFPQAGNNASGQLGPDRVTPRSSQNSSMMLGSVLDGYSSDSSTSDIGTPDVCSAEESLGARTKVLRLLCSDRLDELETDSKVVLIDALMKLGLQAHKMNEQWLWNIIRSTEAEELMRLKNLMDSKGTYHTLFKLVYSDIHDTTILRMVKAHLKREGAVVRSRRMWRALAECWRRRQKMPKDLFDADSEEQLVGLARIMVDCAKGKTVVTPGHACGSGFSSLTCLKILSDLDDTLYSSGGDGIGGVDLTLEKHVLYPGVLSFLHELDLGPVIGAGREQIAASPNLGNLVFLSARPHLYKNMSESYSYSLFERLQLEEGMHCSPTLLAGELRSSLTNSGIAEKKLDNFKGYSELYPEYNFVFIGDNGQGDVIAGASMLEQERTRCVVVFIHRVQPIEKTPGYSEAEYVRWKELGIFFFENYVEAALQAYTIGMISMSALRRVLIGATKRFNNLPEPSGKRKVLRASMRAALFESIEAASKLLPESWAIEEELAGKPPEVLAIEPAEAEGAEGAVSYTHLTLPTKRIV